MPSLIELKNKWFIPMSGDIFGVPMRRHTEGGTGSQISVSTDGNAVLPLIDGQVYMRRWHDELLALHASPGAEFMHAGWKFQAVKTLGFSGAGTDSLDDINAANAAGAKVYPLACGNLANFFLNLKSVDWLRLHGVWTASIDTRFPAGGGSNHQKFAILKSSASTVALLGSIDIAKRRWDKSTHLPDDPDRDPTARKSPSHDTGVAIVGPAVADIELSYRERWNDATSTLGLRPTLPPVRSLTVHLRHDPPLASIPFRYFAHTVLPTLSQATPGRLVANLRCGLLI